MPPPLLNILSKLKKLERGALVSLRNKISNACKRRQKFLNRRLKKPLSIRVLKSGGSNCELRRIFSILRCFKSSRDMDRVMELKSYSDAGYSIKEPFPSPLTPAYVKLSAAKMMEVSGQQDLEDACRSFKNYLVEMIAGEGRMRDLTDVEELLFCWKHLECPVFVDLVCRFYGELCRDLFSNASQDDGSTSKRHLN